MLTCVASSSPGSPYTLQSSLHEQVLDNKPGIDMLEYFPQLMEGLFLLLGDERREIRVVPPPKPTHIKETDDVLQSFLSEIKNSLLFTFPEDTTDRLLLFFQNYCTSFSKLFPMVWRWVLRSECKSSLKREINILFNQLMILVNYSVAHRVRFAPNPHE